MLAPGCNPLPAGSTADLTCWSKATHSRVPGKQNMAEDDRERIELCHGTPQGLISPYRPHLLKIHGAINSLLDKSIDDNIPMTQSSEFVRFCGTQC